MKTMLLLIKMKAKYTQLPHIPPLEGTTRLKGTAEHLGAVLGDIKSLLTKLRGGRSETSDFGSWETSGLLLFSSSRSRYSWLKGSSPWSFQKL